MNNTIEDMLKNYNVNNIYDKKNAIKEILQEIVLCGLARADFFKDAAFYGETALRIFHGLDRFSEDLDFSLIEPNLNFTFSKYFPTLEKEIKSYGLNLLINEKVKSIDSTIASAFVKGNTKELLLSFYTNESVNVTSNETIKIKFKVDINPPSFAKFEHKYRLLPSPYEVNMYDLSSLFAGKIHAVLCRAWKNRVKGRDLYDFAFYLSKNASVNRKHLRERLIDSGFINKDNNLDLDELKAMLYLRFDTIDFAQAKKDVEPFIQNVSMLDIWSADFFKDITNNLHYE